MINVKKFLVEVTVTTMSEYVYLDLLEKLVNESELNGFHDARTKERRVSLYGQQMRFDLSQGFPLLTTKKVYLRAIIHELLWFLSGDTNVKYLQDNNVTIWDEWATAEQAAKFGREEGDLGKVYGYQWRSFNGSFDQIDWVVNEIKTNPYSTRLIVTGWNPIDAQEVHLPPCHTLFQFFVNKGRLSCQLYQRK